MKRLAILLTIFLATAPAMQAAGEERFEFKARVEDSERLLIEASGDIDAVRPLIAAFQSTHPSIHVTYVDNLTNDLFDKLGAACRNDVPIADLVFSSSVDHMVRLANDGCAQSHVSEETAAIPEYNRWRDEVFGFTFEPAVIVYNKKLVPPADVPRNRDQLIDLIRNKAETYTGRIGTYDMEASGIGYLFGFYDAQQSSAFGRLIEGMGRAKARRYCCTGDLLSDIEAGNVLIGYNLIGSYAARRLLEGAPIGIVLPSDYTLVLSRAAYIPKTAPNPEMAKTFLDFLLSEGGQKAAEESFFFTGNGVLPKGVEGPGAAQLAGIFRPIPISPALIAVTDRHKRKQLLDQWQQAFELK